MKVKKLFYSKLGTGQAERHKLHSKVKIQMKVEGQISKTKVFDPMRDFTRCPFKEETGETW